MNRLLLILSGFLVLLNVGWIWSYYKSGSEYRDQLGSNQRWVENLKNQLETDRKVMNTMIVTNNHSLPPDELVTTPEGDCFSLNDVLGKKIRLILYFSDSHCNSCLEQILVSLQQLTPRIVSNHLVVIYSRTDSPQIKWKKLRMLLPDVPFYELSNGSLDKSLEQSNHPFICICSADLTIQVPLIIYPSDEDQVKSYIELNADKYFN